MGRFVNPDNSAFQFALNSRIYVDKTDIVSMHDGERDEEMSCQWLTIGSISAILRHISEKNRYNMIEMIFRKTWHIKSKGW